VVPVSTFGSGLVFACLLVCLAMASLSNSAPRLSRCLHHHEPGAREARRAATKREAVDTHSNARFGGEVEWNRAGQGIFRWFSVELERPYCIADHRLSC
jgi:hypothetical protein